MRLHQDFVRRLGSSKFNYWFGYVANLTLVSWLISHAFSVRGPQLRASQFVVYAAIGLLSWSLSEYVLHRYVYHVWESFLSVGHDLHHKDPRALIGVPWYITSVVLVALYTLLATFFNPAVTGVIMGFNWLGYIFYCVCHHGSHHWSFKNPWFRRMKRNHLLHHAYPEYNWGFTTSFWDHVFRTAWREDVRAQARADRAATAIADRQSA